MSYINDFEEKDLDLDDALKQDLDPKNLSEDFLTRRSRRSSTSSSLHSFNFFSSRKGSRQSLGNRETPDDHPRRKSTSDKSKKSGAYDASQGKYLPCHYFDFIAGSSTGG